MAERFAWEYRVDGLGNVLSGAKEDELERMLNEWGEDGWEVVSVLPRENSGRLTAIARRPLAGDVRRRRTRPA